MNRLCLMPSEIAFSGPANSSRDVMFSVRFSDLWKEKGTHLRFEQRHITQQLFDGPMGITGIIALEIVFGIKHNSRFPPHEGILVMDLKRPFTLDGVIG